MFQDELQLRAHDGDQSAFRDIYSRYSREVYAVSHTALGSADSARAVVKQVFLQLYRELMRTEADLDLPARLSALTNEEIRITRIASGDLDPNALLVQYTVASTPAAPAENTMDRIRAHMQQSVITEAPAGEPVEAEPQQAVEFDSLQESTTIEQTFAEAFEASCAENPEPFSEEAPAAEPQPDPEPAPAAPIAAEETDEKDAAPRKSRKGSVIAGLILAILLVLFVWLLAGILMDLEILPFVDLGYSLFNEHVFAFFRLG